MSPSPNPYEPSTILSETELADTSVGSKILADRSTRFVARLIDGVIGMVVTLPLMFATGYLQRAMEGNVSIMESGISFVAGFVFYLAIHGYLLATRGQTVGKMLMNIRITDLQTGQLLPLVKLVTLRDLVFALISVIPVIGPWLNLVNILFIFSSDRRCLHDRIAGTIVVKA